MFYRTVQNQMPLQKQGNGAASIIKDPYVLEFLGIKPDRKANESG